MVMFVYLQPVLLYTNKKLKVAAWPTSVNASVFYSIHQQRRHVVFLVISVNSESEHHYVFKYLKPL